MNIRLILRTTGRALLVECICILLSLIVCMIYHEDSTPFLLSAGIVLLVAIPLNAIPVRKPVFTPREGLVSVAAIWVAMSLLGAIPFWIDGSFGGPVNCIFESVSGFTTTAASVLSDIENLSKGILFWRGFTHWLGGMGVLVLALAIFPSMGTGTNNLMFNESPGPVINKLLPTIAGSAKCLYLIYIALTAVLVIILCICGLELFDSILAAFGTAGTGGCAVLNDSIAGYANPAAEIVITVFMLLFGINFSIFFLILTGRLKRALNSSEFRLYCGIALISVAVLTISISPLYSSVWEALRYASFQAVSFLSTTGYFTADFNGWPPFSQMLLVLLMMIGTCAGSTGGGIKCSRIVILSKSLFREAGRMLHPQSVKRLRMNGKNISESTITSVMQFFFAYFLIVVLGSLLISLDSFTFQETVTATIACISNTGYGLGAVGPGGSYAMFSVFSKLLFSLLMLLGRLEIFPILMLFHPATWRRM